MTHPFVTSTAEVERTKAIASLEDALRNLRYVVDAPYAIRLASEHIEAALEACDRSKAFESRMNDEEEAAE